jgi:DNA-binding transcriptional ArsR family regulator
MVNSRDSLSKTFSALSDPTRRGILERLSRGETRVTKLAEPYRMSLPAISKHLRVLEQACLIRRSRVGREHRIRIDPKPLERARDWIAIYADAWRHQFEALERYLQDTAAQDDQPETSKRSGKTKQRPPAPKEDQ